MLGSFGNQFECLQPSVRQVDCFVVCGTVRCIFCRLQKVLEGTRPIPALLEMHSWFGGDFIFAIAVDRDSAFGDPLMNLRAAHRRYQAIRNVAV